MSSNAQQSSDPASRAESAAFLRAIPLLADLSDELRHILAGRCRTVNLLAGEWLFRQGGPGDAAYVVRSGRLEVLAEGPPPVVIRDLKRGAVVGELALLTALPRSAAVRARRDSELIELDRSTFELLVREAPDFALGLTRSIGTQLAASHSPPVMASAPRTIAVVALDRGSPIDFVADAFAQELGRYGSCAHLRPDSDRHPTDFAPVLDRLEAEHERVLLSAPPDSRGQAWTEFCLREADLVVALTAGAPDPEWTDQPAGLHGCELVVVGPAVTDTVLTALAPRETQVIGNESGLRGAIRTTSRRLAGRAVGLVLSGGGAKAFAHIGVIDELSAAGLTIDRVGGTSMGSIIAALAATGRDPDEIYERCARNFVSTNPSNDYTLPMFSLIRGRKTYRLLADAFGPTRIEELPQRFFCVSCDLISRTAVTHRTGLLCDAVFASLAIPGIFPPIADGDRLLVDGGVLDNLPVEVMARRGEGPVIAVDVSQRAGAPIRSGRPLVERVARPLRRALTGREAPLPRVSETLLRTLTLGSADTVAAAGRHADLVIAPRVDGVGMLEWKSLPQAREIGREAAREALATIVPLLDEWRR